MASWRVTILAVVVVLAVLVLGCDDAVDDRTSPLSTTRPDELVSYVHAGGLTGFVDHLTVSRSGLAELTGTHPPRRMVAQLTDEELARLKANLRMVDMKRLGPGLPFQGPDSQGFSLQYEGHDYALDYDLPPEVEPVVEQLDPLFDRLNPTPG